MILKRWKQYVQRQGRTKRRKNCLNWTQVGRPSPWVWKDLLKGEVFTWRATAVRGKLKVGQSGLVHMSVQGVHGRAVCALRFDVETSTHLFFSSSLCVDLQRQKNRSCQIKGKTQTFACSIKHIKARRQCTQLGEINWAEGDTTCHRKSKNIRISPKEDQLWVQWVLIPIKLHHDSQAFPVALYLPFLINGQRNPGKVCVWVCTLLCMCARTRPGHATVRVQWCVNNVKWISWFLRVSFCGNILKGYQPSSWCVSGRVPIQLGHLCIRRWLGDVHSTSVWFINTAIRFTYIYFLHKTWYGHRKIWRKQKKTSGGKVVKRDKRDCPRLQFSLIIWHCLGGPVFKLLTPIKTPHVTIWIHHFLSSWVRKSGR